MERYWDEVAMSRANLTSKKFKVCGINSKLNGVRERSEGSGFDWRDTVNRDNTAVRRDRYKTERIFDSLQ